MGRMRQSFTVLVREALLHELALENRWAVTKRSDTTRADVGSQSLV